MKSYEERECGKCKGIGCAEDGHTCSMCVGTGRYQPKLKRGWEISKPFNRRCHAEAVLDGNEWCFIGWCDDDGEEHGEIEWPFEKEWADAGDFELLGFSIVVA